ncbi:hypothetical protein ACJJTC_012150 [Scirpophaga incertulas]
MVFQVPIKLTPDSQNIRKSRGVSKLLSKTNVIECNVKPGLGLKGPCTCSLDFNISDTIQNIFEQVDVDQKDIAEDMYLKYIAKKIMNNNVQMLDTQELSFLHLKVCRMWKVKLSKEESLQKRIFSLESELISRQRNAQQHIVELDRKVEEEKRRLQEVREAVFRSSPMTSRAESPQLMERCTKSTVDPITAEKEVMCPASKSVNDNHLGEKPSTGDFESGLTTIVLRHKRTRQESNRATSAKQDVDERKPKRLYSDEPPTRLRPTRHGYRGHKK